jgi:glycosyltransferase involved in cell wall biosynthesis
MAKKSTRLPRSRQKRVLYIITKSVWGGANRYIFDLATNLKNSHQIYIAAGDKGRFYQKLKKTGIPYYNINHFQRSINLFKDIFAFFEVLGLLFQIKPNIVHVNSSKAGGIVGVAGWIYRLFSFKKLLLVFTAHGWAFKEDRPKWQIELIKFFSKLTALFYHKIICVSKYDRKIALKNKITSRKKLIAIHNGIDIEGLSFLSKREAQKKLLGRISPLVIGTIAEWTKNKGIFYFLESLKDIKKDEFDVILIGSGENPDKYELYNYIQENKMKNIHLIEWIENAASYLKAFDVFVLPSVKEGLPYTILEAMAAKVPIVATNVGGIPEMIQDNITGILTKPKNSQELATKINQLINNPQKTKRIAEKARRKLEEEFSLETMLKETRKIYHDQN